MALQEPSFSCSCPPWNRAREPHACLPLRNPQSPPAKTYQHPSLADAQVQESAQPVIFPQFIYTFSLGACLLFFFFFVYFCMFQFSGNLTLCIHLKNFTLFPFLPAKEIKVFLPLYSLKCSYAINLYFSWPVPKSTIKVNAFQAWGQPEKGLISVSLWSLSHCLLQCET